MSPDILKSLPPQLRLMLAIPLAKLSREEQFQLFEDVNLFITALENHDGNTVIDILERYNIAKTFREKFG